MVVLATIAAVIASQALISGAFSLTRQAIQLGYCPRLNIEHTSATELGQIYIPQVNWALMFATLGLVLGFQSSSGLAAAYGIAVTSTMVITTMLAYIVARSRGGQPAGRRAVAAFFLVIELAFFAANLVKIAHGGWFSLVVGFLAYTSPSRPGRVAGLCWVAGCRAHVPVRPVHEGHRRRILRTGSPGTADLHDEQPERHAANVDPQPPTQQSAASARDSVDCRDSRHPYVAPKRAGSHRPAWRGILPRWR